MGARSDSSAGLCALLLVIGVGPWGCQAQRTPPPAAVRALPNGIHGKDPAKVYRAQQELADWTPSERDAKRASLIELYAAHVAKGPSPWWVANAAAMLAWLEAPEALLSALTHEDPNIRALAMLFAWRLPRRSLAEGLLSALHDQSEIRLYFRTPVGMANDQGRSKKAGFPFPLGPVVIENQRLGQLALTGLLAMMGLNDARVHEDRAAAARLATELVGRYGSRLGKTRPLAKAMLADADPEVRLWSTVSLLNPRNVLVPMERPGPEGPPPKYAPAKESLEALLSNPDPSIRLRAALAAGRLGQKTALAELHRRLPDHPEKIAPVLATLKQRSSIPLLIAELESSGSARVIETRPQRLMQDGKIVEHKLQVTVRDRVLEALIRITGKDLGPDTASWKAFLEKRESDPR